AGEHEALQLRERLVEGIAEALELVDLRLRRPKAALDLDGDREVGADVEELVLDPLERGAKRLREIRRREHDAELRVQLVDGAECREARVELRDPGAVAEARLARVAAARVDARETNGLVGPPRAHRREVTVSAQSRDTRLRFFSVRSRVSRGRVGPDLSRARVPFNGVIPARSCARAARGSNGRSRAAGSRSSPRRSP